MPAPHRAERPRISPSWPTLDLTALDSDAARLAPGRAKISRDCGSQRPSAHLIDRRRRRAWRLVGWPAVRPHPRRRSVHGVGHRAPPSGRQVAAAQERHRGVRARNSGGSSPACGRCSRPAACCCTRPARSSRQKTSCKSRLLRHAPGGVARNHQLPADMPHAAANSCLRGRARATIRTASSTRCSARLDAASRRAPSAAAPPCRRNSSPICAGMPSALPSRSLADPPADRAGAARACERTRRDRLVLALAASPPARADTIPVKSAELRIEEGEVLLNAEFDLALQFRRSRRRCKRASRSTSCSSSSSRAAAGTGWTRRSRKRAITSRVSYNALTRQYRVASGLLGADLQLARGSRALHRPRHVAAGRAGERARPRARATTRRFACAST